MRANDEHCACAIAALSDDTREPRGRDLAAGVLLARDCGVKDGVGNGPKRAKDGVGGSNSGFGSRKRGA